MKEGIKYRTRFFDLFESTIDLVHACTYENKNSEVSAIFQSILLIEATANCCLFNLNINAKLREELDKLSILAKFDTYLLIKSGGSKSLNRGSSTCQDMQELISLRNMIVHPKLFKTTWVTEEKGYHEVTKKLKISVISSAWTANDSITVFKAVTSFINYFFLEVCELSEKETRLLLLASKNEIISDTFIYSENLKQLCADYNIPLQLWEEDE